MQPDDFFAAVSSRQVSESRTLRTLLHADTPCCTEKRRRALLHVGAARKSERVPFDAPAIRAARDSIGLTNRELAIVIGLGDKSTTNMLSAGIGLPEHIMALCTALRLDYGEVAS